ncbi:hypothetical protein B7494_g7712 [Chlorociboria aeruginascens]|nr:hypothetical protein B7494_g7712 [Chlorociboria aeruginascens]
MAYPIYAIASIAFLVIYLAKYITSSISASRFKQKHGCEPIARLPQSERILGLGLYRTLRQSSKNKVVLEKAKQRYDGVGNTWECRLLGRRFVNTIEPENIKTILATNFKDFGLGKRIEGFGALLGAGIFTTDGTQWEHSRALVRPSFTKSQVADLDTFEIHIQHLISKIPLDDSTVDLSPLFFQLTFDSATEFLFGSSVNSLDSVPGSPQEIFGTAYDFAQSKLGQRMRLGKLAALFPQKEFYNACDTVHNFVDKIVEKALNKSSMNDDEKFIDGKERDKYVFLDELAKETRDPKQLRAELLNILLAGRDTTASLLSNTFHVLARRPDIWRKLQAEIEELGGKRPTYESLKGMKYLKCLLNEALRLYPVVPTNGRYAQRDTVLPRGGGPNGTSPVYIPAGTLVAYSTYTMHRSTAIYGADALEFRPERWGPEENLRPGWGYLPFNGGPRICVGQQFALTEASYTIVRLLQKFKGIEDRDGGPWVERLTLTATSDKGVKNDGDEKK